MLIKFKINGEERQAEVDDKKRLIDLSGKI